MLINTYHWYKFFCKKRISQQHVQACYICRDILCTLRVNACRCISHCQKNRASYQFQLYITSYSIPVSHKLKIQTITKCTIQYYMYIYLLKLFKYITEYFYPPMRFRVKLTVMVIKGESTVTLNNNNKKKPPVLM